MTTTDKAKITPLRLGVIGTGQISQILLPLLPLETIAIAGLTDLNPDSARALAEKSGSPPIFSDYTSLFASKEIEAVYIATPPSTHLPLTLAALKAGKHVICEKPWMLNADEAQKVAAEVAKHPDLKVGCCSSRFCFSPAAEVARQKVSATALGTLRQARIIARVDRPSPLDKLPPWMRSIQLTGGGAGADWGVYEIEWLRSILGSALNPVSLTATLDYWGREGSGLESSYQVTISCADNLEVQLIRTAEIGPSEHCAELRGDRAGLNVPFAPNAKDNLARLYTLGPDGKAVETLLDVPPTEDWGLILCGPLLNLAAAVRLGTPVAASAESQILVHEILDAIYTSGREGHPLVFKK